MTMRCNCGKVFNDHARELWIIMRERFERQSEKIFNDFAAENFHSVTLPLRCSHCVTPSIDWNQFWWKLWKNMKLHGHPVKQITRCWKYFLLKITVFQTQNLRSTSWILKVHKSSNPTQIKNFSQTTSSDKKYLKGFKAGGINRFRRASAVPFPV